MSLKYRMWAQDGLIKEQELNTSFVSLLLWSFLLIMGWEY